MHQRLEFVGCITLAVNAQSKIFSRRLVVHVLYMYALHFRIRISYQITDEFLARQISAKT